MRERPILFSGPLVRAILEGRKTQTRRIVKLGDHGRAAFHGFDGVHGVAFFGDSIADDPVPLNVPCPYGAEGDRLWVRESHAFANRYTDLPAAEVDRLGDRRTWYRADLVGGGSDPAGGEPTRWRPSIHMPRWASRIDLEVTEVRVERLQEITAADVRAEGALPSDEVVLDAPAIARFELLWDGINGDRASWSSNPWVWVVSFRRVRP